MATFALPRRSLWLVCSSHMSHSPPKQTGGSSDEAGAGQKPSAVDSSSPRSFSRHSGGLLSAEAHAWCIRETTLPVCLTMYHPAGRGGEITQTPASSAASQRHGSPLASSGAPLPHQARSHRPWEPDIPLPFHTPPPCLPQLLGGPRAESGVHAARLLRDARCLRGLQGRFAPPKAGLESKSMGSKAASCE